MPKSRAAAHTFVIGRSSTLWTVVVQQVRAAGLCNIRNQSSNKNGCKDQFPNTANLFSTGFHPVR